MHSLYETKTEFKTFELLKMMVALSRHKIIEGHYGKHKLPFMECIVKFNLGRASGHTDAIMNYLEVDDGDSVIVCGVSREVDRLRYEYPQIDKNRIASVDTKYLGNPKRCLFIFDNCSDDQIYKFLGSCGIYYNIQGLVSAACK